MKIAIVTDRIYPFFKGGAEKRYWDIAEFLVKKGHRVCFYTAQWPGMKKEMAIEGIKIYSVYKVKNFYIKGRKSITESLKFCFGLIFPLLRGDYDLIDCESVPLFSIFPCKVASLIKKKPLIVTWHEVWGNYWYRYLGWRGIFGKLVEKIAALCPDLIITVSSKVKRDLLNISHKKVQVSNNWINLTKIKRAKACKERSDVVFVGRLIEHKKVDVLIKAIKALSDKSKGRRIKCKIIGDGPESENLKAIAKSNGLNNIKFKGVLKSDEEVYSNIKSSKVFVFPSTREGFGIAVLEANACGLPALVTDHKNNASRFLIKNGKNGYVCKLDEKDFAAKIELILNSYKQKNWQKGCIKTSMRYDESRLLNEIEKTYLENVQTIV